MWVLAGLGAKATPAVSRLIQLLSDNDKSVRNGALMALGHTGKDAKEAAPPIIKALESEDRIVREIAAQALRRLDPDRATKLLGSRFDPVAARHAGISESKVQKHDWPQLGGSSFRNNTPAGKSIPTHWNSGKFDRRTGKWDAKPGINIKWVRRLGSQTYGNPVVANGKIYVGTNNAAGYLKRYPSKVDLGCLLCLREADGKFLWQHSSEKLPTGRVHDWPLQGICSSPAVEGDRLWFVTNRGEVRCLDTEGFYDGQNDGPYQDEAETANDEADVVWVFDMMAELGVSQHNMATCAPTLWGDVLFICTSNGVDDRHINIPAPEAPSFMAMDKKTGKVLWTDNSPGKNILHGQWSCPVVGLLDGVPQVIFPGGDGWLYSFRADRWKDGKPELLWKFDCNPKRSKWEPSGRGTRNSIIAVPTIYDGLVYVAVGQDPEHGEGDGHLWCIDPTKRGDVSEELAVGADGKSIPHRRLLAVDETKGERAIPNPNSSAVWHYSQFDHNGNGEIDDFVETFHRTIGSPAIKNDLLFIADFSGLAHCLNAKTGVPYWTCDLLAACWGTPLIVEDKVYIGDEDGDIAILRLSPDPSLSIIQEEGSDEGLLSPIHEINMGNFVHTMPIVANNVLYIATRSHLFAIASPSESTSD